MTAPGVDPLAIDAGSEIERITAAIRSLVPGTLRRWGAVVALSGGIDSSVVGALCVRALGRARVLGLILPEQDSSPETVPLARRVVAFLGVESVHQDITPILDACGCYRSRDEAIRSAVPAYRSGDRAKLVLPAATRTDMPRVFSVVVQHADGTVRRARLGPAEYRQIVAATNFKQRVRAMLAYHHADRLNYAVAGTPNRLEYDQGFFVKNGDGAADFEPIAHLYKAQVYRLAAALGVPAEVRERPPTTDTYSMPQSQEEFYFSLPYRKMDLALFAFDHGWPVREAAAALELEPVEVERVYRDIASKRRAAAYLHARPLGVSP